jgi:hypothetical protein
MMAEFDLASTRSDERIPSKTEVLLEAARRANWDALHGPKHLRAGRYRSMSSTPGRRNAEGAAQPGVAVDGAAPPLNAIALGTLAAGHSLVRRTRG